MWPRHQSPTVIWTHARDHGFVIVSKDEDFHRLSVLLGPPPKVIWIRLGNCTTEDVIRLREELAEQIRSLKELKEMASRYGFDWGQGQDRRARALAGDAKTGRA